MNSNGKLDKPLEVEKPKTLAESIAEIGTSFTENLAKSDEKKAEEYLKARVDDLIGGAEIAKPLFYESITEALDPASGARIRVWRREAELPEYQDTEILLLVARIPRYASMRDVINIISTLPRVTAIELVDPHKNGAVTYLEW